MQEVKKQRESFDDIFNGELTPSHNPPPTPPTYYTPEPEPQRNITAEPEDEPYESNVAVAVIEQHDSDDLAVFSAISSLPPLEEYNVAMDVNPDFIEWEVNKPVRLWYIGQKTIKKKENGVLVDLPVVVFKTAEGTIRIDAGYKLRDTLHQFTPPAPFEITYIGDKKVNNGKMKDFLICHLSKR